MQLRKSGHGRSPRTAKQGEAVQGWPCGGKRNSAGRSRGAVVPSIPKTKPCRSRKSNTAKSRACSLAARRVAPLVDAVISYSSAPRKRDGSMVSVSNAEASPSPFVRFISNVGFSMRSPLDSSVAASLVFGLLGVWAWIAISPSRAEGVDVLRVLSGRQLQHSPLHLPKHEFATFGCNRHKETNPGSGRRSILRSLKNHGLAVSNNSEFKLIDGTAD